MLSSGGLQVTQSTVYRTAANRLYPVISTYADPALDTDHPLPYYQAAVDHLRPQASCAVTAAPKEALLSSRSTQRCPVCSVSGCRRRDCPICPA